KSGATLALPGRYGKDLWPTWSTVAGRTDSRIPHFYAQVDFDGCVSPAVGAGTGGTPTPRWTLPTGAMPFPTFPTPGYDNGINSALGNKDPERSLHPWEYNVLTPQVATLTRPAEYDRAFSAAEMERLLRFKDTGAPALVSDLERLLPKNFNDPGDP